MGVARSLKRNIAKNKYAYLKDMEKMDIIDQKVQIFRNGITADDLAREFKKGYGAGWSDGREQLYKEVFAAICLVMGEEKDNDEIIDFLHDVDNRTQISIDANEDLDEVLNRYGIELHFKNAMDRIERV